MRHKKIAVAVVLLVALVLEGCNNLFKSGQTTGTTIALNGSVPQQINTSQVLNISVTTNNDNGAGVAWSLATGDPGTLSNVTITSVTYTAPPSVTSATPITITATSIADSNVTLAIDTTIEPARATSGGLNGQYAFLLRGFDASDNGVAMVGSFTADGHGNITAGAIDVNNNFAIGQNTGSLAGIYTIDGSQRGQISITTAITQVSQPLTFAYTLSADGTRGDLISFDSNGFQLSGRMQKQDSTAFNVSSLSASYAFELESDSQPPRQGEIGQFAISTGMQVTGIADTTLAENGYGGEAAFGGSVNNTPDANGRGSINLVGANGTAGTNLVYYIVSASQLDLMEIDSATASITLLAGVAQKQNLPFSNATLNPVSVFALSGLDGGTTITGAIASVGTLNPTLKQFVFDTNDVGTIKQSAGLRIQNISFDPATGRGTIAALNGYATGLFDQSVFYIYDSGAGFLMDATPDGRNRALMGGFWPQSSTMPSTPSGNLIGRFGDGADISIATMDTALSVSSSAQATASADVRAANHADLSDQSFSGGTLTAPNQNTGRGSGILPGSLFGLSTNTNSGDSAVVYYLVDTDHFVLVTSVQGLPSGVGIFEPQ